MPKDRVKITKDGQEAEVNPRSVAAYERHGWTRVDDGSSTTPAAPAAPAAPAKTKEG